jgi:hypothetical protein
MTKSNTYQEADNLFYDYPKMLKPLLATAPISSDDDDDDDLSRYLSEPKQDIIIEAIQKFCNKVELKFHSPQLSNDNEMVNLNFKFPDESQNLNIDTWKKVVAPELLKIGVHRKGLPQDPKRCDDGWVTFSKEQYDKILEHYGVNLTDFYSEEDSNKYQLLAENNNYKSDKKLYDQKFQKNSDVNNLNNSSINDQQEKRLLENEPNKAQQDSKDKAAPSPTLLLSNNNELLPESPIANIIFNHVYNNEEGAMQFIGLLYCLDLAN